MAQKGKPRKRKRETYIHDAEDLSIASNAVNRRLHKEFALAPPRSPEKRAYDRFDELMGYSTNDDMFEQPPVAREGPAAIKVRVRAKRYNNSDHPVHTFIPLRDAYGDALMKREGRGSWSSTCTICQEPNPTWRCGDCFGGRMLCTSCVMERHRDEPLHCLQVWEDGFFHPKTTKNLGLCYQIGHPPGELCSTVHLTPPVKDFVVLHDNGIHIIDIEFCNCEGSPSQVDQLINIGWFPATSLSPGTAASLSLLRRFHALNLQARVPAYDFYNALVLLRHGSGVNKPPSRLPQFMHMVREYRHLQMCKHAGRLHDARGIAGTKERELAIECRACPQPGINLPEGWETAPPEIAWIYRVMVSKDANFKMKGRDRSSREKDPTLGPGWAYMVANDAYLQHLAKYVKEDEISHCVSFAALWSANNKRAKGLRASGVGSVSCSRHEMFRPGGMGDLQKGERYSNMDYLFFSSLIGITALGLVASYNIACQWSRNFWERAKKMPAHMRLPEGIRVIFKVPKFHLPPHVKECHGPYSFNYTKGVGRTDGEGVERNWSWLNWAARFITVMGPGSREDTIDDLCGFSNWKKTVDLGNSLLRKLVLALPQAMMHSRVFHAFTEGLRDGHEKELQDWEKTVRAWEENPLEFTGANPYDYPEVEGETMADVLKRVSEEEHGKVAKDSAAALLVRPESFLMAGIEIEEAQAAVALEAKRKTRTTIQATALQRQRTILLGKVSALRDVQGTYMPGLRQWVAQQSPAIPAPNNAKPETIKIHLPSALLASERSAICVAGLVELEDALRGAQARAALRDLRSGLRTRTFAHRFKRQHMGGRESCYRVVCAALLALRGSGEWETVLQELRKEDIRGINERAMNEEEKEENRKARVLAGLAVDGEADELDAYGEPVDLTVLFNLETGEGRRQLSWLWYTATTSADAAKDGSLHPDIRVEWMKARARADRWREEIMLVDEEMRRVLDFCTWKANWWMERVNGREGVSEPLAEGLRAYALEQATRERAWATSWGAMWSPEVLVPLLVELEEEDDEMECDPGFEEEEEDMLLREQRKRGSEERNSRDETYTEFMTRECEELRGTPEFKEFREFCNKVKAVRLHVDFKNPDEVCDLDLFLCSNPSVEDLPAYDDDHVEFLYRCQEWYPKWREELEDYCALITENSAEVLDQLQVEARAKLSNQCIILARGGF
ncbi:hypothetical protein B0H13DRAFT_2348668 [Mycena leptocephala]|nr:hypothetical protein B0H13DRAFT_2348668 [Mycena leptocephala]